MNLFKLFINFIYFKDKLIENEKKNEKIENKDPGPCKTLPISKSLPADIDC